MAASLAVVLGLTVGVARLGRAVVDAARAQTAADAAALAALEGGETQARRTAERNGAVVVVCRCGGDPVEVVVSIGSAEATARASRLP